MNRLGRYSLIVAAIAAAGALAVWIGRPADDLRVEKFQDRERFQSEVREFFARAPTLAPEERAARAREIASAITHYEATGEIVAAEALTLRTALISATVEDPVEQVVAIRALQELYQGGAPEQPKN